MNGVWSVVTALNELSIPHYVMILYLCYVIPYLLPISIRLPSSSLRLIATLLQTRPQPSPAGD